MSVMASEITGVCIVYLFGRRSNKASKLRVPGICAGNSPVTGEFPAQTASNAENIFIDDVIMKYLFLTCLLDVVFSHSK